MLIKGAPFVTHCPMVDVTLMRKYEYFKPDLRIEILSTHVKANLEWTPEDLIDGESTLVQVMTCFREGTSHNLDQRWQSFPAPYGVTTPEWVKIITSQMARFGYPVNGKGKTSTGVGTKRLFFKVTHIVSRIPISLHTYHMIYEGMWSCNYPSYSWAIIANTFLCESTFKFTLRYPEENNILTS